MNRLLKNTVLWLLIVMPYAYSYSESTPINLHIKDKETEIFSASRENESAFKSASSVFILSSDDIRRSGATNIPEALRLVPGIEVYRAGSSKWSITSRGFGRLYDNKILVMVDGREIYSSVFNGANWDVTDMILDDVEKIEIIRGGSNTSWGANSLNGVINIITKRAQYSQGSHLSALYGNQEKSSEFRYGGNNGKNIFYRAYAKKVYRNGLKSIDYLRGNQYSNAGDKWNMAKGGFRIDWQKDLRDEITFQGDINDGVEDQILYIPTQESKPIYNSEYVNGFNFDSRWKRNANKNESFNLHSYLDVTSRKSQLGSINRDILQFDGSYDIKTTDRNKLKLGFGYRFTSDEMKNGIIDNITVYKYTPNKQNTNFYNAFFQDNFSIIPEKFDITLGGKFEHHYITGSHFLPSLQFRYTPDEENTLWTSYSKGVREPSKLETNMRRLAGNVGPYKIYWQGNPNFDIEKLTSYEIGYRNRSFSRLELDISAFYNNYSNVRSFEPNPAKFQYELNNKGEARVEGINSSVSLGVLDNWKIALGYSYLDMNIKFKDSKDNLSVYDDGVSPHHQLQFQSRWNIGKDIDFDTTFYHVGNLYTVNIKAYNRFDLRLAWRPIQNLELSVVGQKLFYGDTRETTREFYGTHNASYGNQIYGGAKWSF